MKKIRMWMVLLAFSVLGVCAVMAQTETQGPMLGTWKLNVAKSDFGGGTKLGGMQVQVTSDTPGAVKWSTTMITTGGMQFTYSFAGAADGKDHPAVGTQTTYAYAEDGANVTETQKDTDGTVTVGTFSVSPSGKTGTWTYTITDPQGNVVHEKLVFDRVVTTLKAAAQ